MYMPPFQPTFIGPKTRTPMVEYNDEDFTASASTTISHEPVWNTVSVVMMYGKLSLLLNPRRAVELAMLSGTIRKMA